MQGRALPRPLSLLIRHQNPHSRQAAAVVGNARGEVVLDSVAVKSNRYADAGAADNLLLFFVGEEIQHIAVLAVAVDGIIGDVHLPEDVLIGHALEIIQRIGAEAGNVREKIGVCHAHNGGAAPLGEGEKIAAGDGTVCVEILDEAIVEKGDVCARRQGIVRVRRPLEGAYFNAAQDGDLVCILLANEVLMVVITAQSALVVVKPHVGRRAKNAVAAVADAVVVVGNAEEPESSRNGRLHDGLGGVFAAEGVVGMSV